MEENKFEREVRQKMDELKIHPSDSVWEKIASRIEKRKRPNPGLLYLLFFGIFIAGGYLLWTASHQPVTKSNSEKNNNATNTAISTSPNTTNKSETNQKSDSINTPVNTPVNGFAKAGGNKNLSHYSTLATDKKKMYVEKNNVEPESRNGSQHNTREHLQSKIIDGQPQESPIANEEPANQAKDSSDKETIAANLPKVSKEDTKIKDTSKQATHTSANVIHKKKNKWNFGVAFSGGISGVGNKFLGLSNAIPAAYLNGLGSISGPGAVVYVPTRTTSGFGFTAGISAENNITKKIQFVTGLNFASFSTSNKTGPRNNSTSNYSALGAINNYHNHFNFIGIPMSLKVRLGSGKMVPLYWQGGVVISELIGSNALQFNQSQGYYYTDNSFFNKTQLGLNTSFSIAVFSGVKNSFLVGPYFYYDASKLAKDGLYSDKHFVFTGLRAEMIFGK